MVGVGTMSNAEIAVAEEKHRSVCMENAARTTSNPPANAKAGGLSCWEMNNSSSFLL